MEVLRPFHVKQNAIMVIANSLPYRLLCNRRPACWVHSAAHMSQSGKATTPSRSVAKAALAMWAVCEAGSAG